MWGPRPIYATERWTPFRAGSDLEKPMKDSERRIREWVDYNATPWAQFRMRIMLVILILGWVFYKLYILNCLP